MQRHFKFGTCTASRVKIIDVRVGYKWAPRLAPRFFFVVVVDHRQHKTKLNQQQSFSNSLIIPFVIKKAKVIHHIPFLDMSSNAQQPRPDARATWQSNNSALINRRCCCWLLWSVWCRWRSRPVLIFSGKSKCVPPFLLTDRQPNVVHTMFRCAASFPSPISSRF